MTEKYRYIRKTINASQWYYISKRHYNSSIILITESGLDDWTLIYLTRIANSRKSLEIDLQSDWGEFGDTPIFNPVPYEKGNIEIPQEYAQMRKDFIFRFIEEQHSNGPRIDHDLMLYAPGRQVHGSLGAIVEEFKMLVSRSN